MIIIRRIGVLSLAKFFGLLYGGIGLVGGLLISGFSFLGIILGDLGGSRYGDSYVSASSLGSTLAVVVVLPVIYAILGLIGGIVTAFICNLALRFSGGLELEADTRAVIQVPPAAPPPVIPQ